MVEVFSDSVGKFKDDGSVETEPVNCAFSGRFARGVHHVRERVAGTALFYYILSNMYAQVTNDWREQFARAVKGETGEAMQERVSRRRGAADETAGEG